MSITEKEKMIQGSTYKAWDKELVADRQNAKKLCFVINQTCPTDKDKRH